MQRVSNDQIYLLFILAQGMLNIDKNFVCFIYRHQRIQYRILFLPNIPVDLFIYLQFILA